MADVDHSTVSQLPEEMFTLIRSPTRGLGPRLGCLRLAERKTIETPHYLGLTSRGVIPHLTPDTFARDANVNGVYMSLEDCKSARHAPALGTLTSAAHS